MGRLPFDPDRMRTKRQASPQAGRDAPMSVSALAARVERAVAEAFPRRVAVKGEVSGTRQRTHFYFSLKDDSAVIGAVMFASASKRSEAIPTDGRVVIASGKLEYYAPQGRLSLIVDSLREEGQGSLDARFRALCDELRGLGWFDQASKRPLPVFPRRIAVITSASSAALQDVLDTTRRRCPAVELVLIDALVQGERAAQGLVSILRDLSAAAPSLGIDAVLLTRGGGSVEDLWCFNDRALAQAIRECTIPIVAAIGHESDTTIAELVADRRAATPTQAAMLLTPDREALTQQVDALTSRASRAITTRFTGERRHLDALGARPVLADPSRILLIQSDKLAMLERALHSATTTVLSSRRRVLSRLELALERGRPSTEHARRIARVDAASDRLRDAMRHALRHRRDRLESLTSITEVIGPAAVLRRGYTVTATPEGTILRSSLDANPGDRLTTRFHDGSVDSVIGGHERAESQGLDEGGASSIRSAPSDPAKAGPPSKKRSRSERTDNDSDRRPQMDLFTTPE